MTEHARGKPATVFEMVLYASGCCLLVEVGSYSTDYSPPCLEASRAPRGQCCQPSLVLYAQFKLGESMRHSIGRSRVPRQRMVSLVST